MNTNPFPASFLNFKASLKLAPVLIPGRQTFIDWNMDLMTETHAVQYMRESMNGIMRYALLSKLLRVLPLKHFTLLMTETGF
jgi:hypothetical protein